MFRALGSFSLLCALVFTATRIDSARQNNGKKTSVKDSAVAEGASLYKRNCAVCHGNDAKGGAPPKSSMFTQPASDLTTLARRHENNFPGEYVAKVLRGGVKMPDHGPAEMPVWGTMFKSSAKSDETHVAKRIDSLVAYLKSIQVK